MDEKLLASLPKAPQWSIVVGDLGAVLVACSVALFVLCFAFSILAQKQPKFSRFIPLTFWLGTVSLLGVFSCLATLFLNDRFEWSYVQDHSDAATPMSYKMAAVWSGQEGSFLLWATGSALFGAFSLRAVKQFREWYAAVYSLFLASICGILLYESPFVLNVIHGIAITPPDGRGLSPALLNYWITIHPPTIFLGFGSMTVPFALAVAAILKKDLDSWIPIVRPWALVSLALVGLGLCMGGFWAYETLGWGGFWAWDPVENTSFVPWCFLAFFVHGAIVQTTRKRWHWTNLLLAAAPFLSFLYGTFLTRSGFLGDTSVHSFAEMDRSALWILAGMGTFFIVAFFVLWAKAKKLTPPKADYAVSGVTREPTYAWGGALLTMFALATGFGMSVPLVMSLMGRKPSAINEAQYHQVLPWFFIPLMLLMAAAPFVTWNGTKFSAVFSKVYAPLCVSVFVTGSTLLLTSWTDWAGDIKNEGTVKFLFGLFEVPKVPWTFALYFLCVFVFVANFWRLVQMFKRSKMGTMAFVSHMGVALLMAGLILSRGLESKKQVIVQDKIGPASALNYLVSADGPTGDILNRNNKIKFELQSPSGKKSTLYPGLYFMEGNDGQMNSMAWPAIIHNSLHDVYLALHAMEFDASDPVPMKPGETHNIDRFQAKFLQATREGNPGQPGTKFGAKLELTDPQTGQKLAAHPKWVLGDEGIKQEPALVGDEFFMTLQGMNADTQQYTVQLHFRQPIYAVELFVKPFTIFVWLGTGILTVAVFGAAWYRRPKALSQDQEPAEIVEEKEESLEEKDAISPVAKG